MIDFTTTQTEDDLIFPIVERARALFPEMGSRHHAMNIIACHRNGCPLNLKTLLDFADEDFAHDIVGIEAHLNKQTGKLEDLFLPRSAATSDKDETL